MSILLELTQEEARLLSTHLATHLGRLDAELVRTDQHQLQHELARDIGNLQHVAIRLESAIREQSHPSSAGAPAATSHPR